MTTGYEALLDKGGGKLKKLLAVSATALIASAALAIPALALPTGPGVGEGKNISVFHNLDFVAAFGYTVGEPLTVQVFRDGVEIGSATGPAVEVDEGLPGTERSRSTTDRRALHSRAIAGRGQPPTSFPATVSW